MNIPAFHWHSITESNLNRLKRSAVFLSPPNILCTVYSSLHCVERIALDNNVIFIFYFFFFFTIYIRLGIAEIKTTPLIIRKWRTRMRVNYFIFVQEYLSLICLHRRPLHWCGMYCVSVLRSYASTLSTEEQIAETTAPSLLHLHICNSIFGSWIVSMDCMVRGVPYGVCPRSPWKVQSGAREMKICSSNFR